MQRSLRLAIFSALFAFLFSPETAAGDAAVLRGTVVGPERKLMTGAQVVLVPEGPAATPGGIVTTTDERGGFAFQTLPPGSYRLHAELDGFTPSSAVAVRIGSAPHAAMVLFLRERLPAATTPPADPLTETSPEPSAPGQRTPIPEVAGVPLPDRWRIPLPAWDRYPGVPALDNPYKPRGLWNPYRQNVLKGDLPIVGQNTFLSLSAVSDTLFESRRVPVPSGQSSARPGSQDFFGEGRQNAAIANVLLSADLFHGNAGFRPVDWRFKVTAGLNFNHLAVRERGVVKIDVREGEDRNDEHAGPQEAFGEVKIADLGSRYDFVSVRAGVQSFVSDFRGFVFLDNQPGVRFFGSLFANRIQWNVAGFEMLEKDTNSGLNTTRRRNQKVGVANLYYQDFFFPGYTIQGSFHVNDDRAGSRDSDGGFHYDENGFLVRPAAIGNFRPHDLRAYYYGLSGDGHIGRVNLTHAAYLVRGWEGENPIADRRVRIRAKMAAVEASFDRDWLRFHASAFYASGDPKPADNLATGFDAILDDPNFAGGATSFWNRQGIRLTGTNVGLTGRFSFLPSLRSSKDEGQANFVNPGLVLFGAGVDAELTPRLRITSELNAMRFDQTAVLETLLFQSGPAGNASRGVRRPIGYEASAGINYRPWLTDNAIVTAGLSAFRPADGFRDIYQSRGLYSVFTAMTFTY